MRNFFLLPLLLVCGAAGAAEWYLSNAAGMQLEKQSSALAAARNKYSLSVEKVSFSELPEMLWEYHNGSWIIEVHTLFENGEETRRQWIFRDEKGTARLVAVFDPPKEETENEAAAKNDEGPGDTAAEAAPAGQAPLGFIELYDENSHIIAERQFFGSGDELVTNYSYNKNVLVRAENYQNSRHISTDSYRYSRSASLRAVERVYHEKAAADEGYLVRHRFPHRILDSAEEENFVSPTLAYGSDFLEDLFIEPDYKVLYTTDERGRVLGETHQDDKGNTIGELVNHWSGDRLTSITWKTGEDERRTEYEYDKEGDRILERNYNGETLERVVRRENKREVEELYMNGAVILRAVWDEGRKISEERVR
ncbi:hypothetical protein FACS189450_01400 [Spirochaetia bacterium]|nr:hypothetical protein FACS189450_01400 [Spirochaetia bacterium]